LKVPPPKKRNPVPITRTGIIKRRGAIKEASPILKALIKIFCEITFKLEVTKTANQKPPFKEGTPFNNKNGSKSKP
jgi:hypothetical protein